MSKTKVTDAGRSMKTTLQVLALQVALLVVMPLALLAGWLTTSALRARPVRIYPIWTAIFAVAGVGVVGAVAGSPGAAFGAFWRPVLAEMTSPAYAPWTLALIVLGCAFLTWRTVPIWTTVAVVVALGVAGAVAGTPGAAVVAFSEALGAQVASPAFGPYVAWSAVLGVLFGAFWTWVSRGMRERDALHGAKRTDERIRAEADRVRRLTQSRQKMAHGGPRALQPIAKVLAVPEPRAVKNPEKTGTVVGPAIGGDLRPLGRPVLIERTRHLAVAGATGEGKSVFLHRLCCDSIANGIETIWINCKQEARSTGPSARLAAYAASIGKTANVLAPVAEGLYNPYVGTADEIRARMMGQTDWSESFYEDIATVSIDLALSLAEQYGEPIDSLPSLVWSLLNGQAAALAEEMGDPMAKALANMISDSQRQQAALRWAAQAVRLRSWTGPSGFKLGDADVTAFDLPVSTERDASQAILRVLLSDLETYLSPDSGRRKSGRRVDIYIDELSALAGDPLIMNRVLDLVERARSLGGRGVFSSQSVFGFGDDSHRARLANSADIATFRVADQETVEWVANLAGTQRIIETSSQRAGLFGTGMGSSRTQREFKVHPDTIRTLDKGEMIYIGRRARWAHVAVASTGDAYRPFEPNKMLAVDSMSRAAGSIPKPGDGPAWQVRSLTQGPKRPRPEGEW